MSSPLASVATGLLQAGDRAYQQQDWRMARDFYRHVATLDPAAAPALALPLALGHCDIELAPGDALATTLPEAPPVAGGERLEVLTSRVRFRARQLCRDGDLVRAGHLLRFLARYDQPIADTFARSIDVGSTPPGGFAAATPGGPRFLADGLGQADVEAARRWAGGRRLLLFFRRMFFQIAARTHEPIDLFTSSAEALGFAVHHVNSHVTDPAADPMAPAIALEAAIRDVRPDLIVCDELFATDLASKDPALAARIETVLAGARRELGTRVVNYFIDVWRVPTEIAFRGLGTAIDLVGHMHPAAIGRGSPAESRAEFCYMVPTVLPAPQVPAATIPRACFAGSVYESSIGRLVWWTETARRGLALDFLETDHGAPAQRSDQAFADLFHAYRLSVNFTRRPTGTTIMTGRTFQVMLSGGTLLEEDSVDTAHFFTPGEHYRPFLTLDDLAALIDRMLGDPAGCTRMAEAGHRWATRYFTGDYFWAEMIRRLIA